MSKERWENIFNVLVWLEIFMMGGAVIWWIWDNHTGMPVKCFFTGLVLFGITCIGIISIKGYSEDY